MRLVGPYSRLHVIRQRRTEGHGLLHVCSAVCYAGRFGPKLAWCGADGVFTSRLSCLSLTRPCHAFAERSERERSACVR